MTRLDVRSLVHAAQAPENSYVGRQRGACVRTGGGEDAHAALVDSTEQVGCGDEFAEIFLLCGEAAEDEQIVSLERPRGGFVEAAQDVLEDGFGLRVQAVFGAATAPYDEAVDGHEVADAHDFFGAGKARLEDSLGVVPSRRLGKEVPGVEVFVDEDVGVVGAIELDKLLSALSEVGTMVFLASSVVVAEGKHIPERC